jgi:hypothetical protein
LAALGGSFLLGEQAFKIQNSQNETAKMEEIRGQQRLLTDDIWTGIEGVKARAQAYWLTRSQIGSRAVLDPQILAYAQIENPGQSTGQSAAQSSVVIKDVTRNPNWTHQVLDNLNGAFQKAAQQISIPNIHQSGASVVMVPKTNGLAGQYLAIAFQPQVNSPTAVVAIVDPELVFTSFSRWVTRREAGNLRSYLISADGKVLIHSERAYTGSDFSGSQVYRQALRSLFRGERANGVSTYSGVDLRPVLTSYARLGPLPFALVVERVVRPAGAQIMREILIPSMLLIGAVLMISLLSVVVVRVTSGNRKNNVIQVPEMESALARVSELSDDREEITQLKHQLQAALTRFGHTSGTGAKNADHENTISTEDVLVQMNRPEKGAAPETEN